jgi:hypothetical protein
LSHKSFFAGYKYLTLSYLIESIEEPSDDIFYFCFIQEETKTTWVRFAQGEMPIKCKNASFLY